MARYTFIEQFVGKDEQTDEGYFVDNAHRSTALGDALIKARQEQPDNVEHPVAAGDEVPRLMFLGFWS